MVDAVAAPASQPYSKAQRLLNLLMALRGTEVGLSRDQLRAVVRGYGLEASETAFERMFERDKDELRAMGVPVATLTDSSGVVTGYRIQGDWTLPPLDLTRAELAVLGLAARAWQRADLAPAALNALRKVEAQLGMSSPAAGAAPIAGLSTDSPVLQQLIEACSTRTAVSFDYRKGADGSVGRRAVQPWGTVWWRAHWYLVGFDTDRADVRVFRASRITGKVRTELGAGSYQVPEGFDARAAIGRFARTDEVTFELAVAPGVAAALRQEAELVGAPGDGPTGQDLLRLPVEDLRSGVSAVLAHGAGVRIRGPRAAVVEARRQLDALLAALTSVAPPAGRSIGTSAPPGGPGTAQFSRLLALVPWLAANSGVRVADAAAHFGISDEQLLEDLGSVITSGADDWTLFDIQYWEDDGIIEVIDALDLDAPLTLTPDEGFALMVALNALAAVPGAASSTELESVTATLGAALGPHAPAPGALRVRVDLPDDVVGAVGRAQALGRAIELTYLGAVRDEVTHRIIDPLGVVVVDGYGYLRAYCRAAGGLRMFRVDRIQRIEVSAEPARPVTDPPEVAPMAVRLGQSGRRILVDVAADELLTDRYPVTRRWSLAGGGVRAELPVGDFGWARRLILGSGAQVVLRGPDDLVADLIQTVGSLRAQYADTREAEN
ncbi:MAG: WYL domain-containing protein [Candidatus Nanopelagicales bacterium]